MTIPFDAERKRLIVCSATAILLHAAGGAAVFLGFGAAATPGAPPAAQMVVELADLPSAPPVPPSLAPPEPEQVKAQPKPILVRLDIPPVPKLTVPVAADVTVPLREKTDPQPEPNKAVAQETTRAAAPEAARADAARAPAIGAPSLSSIKAQESWESRILAALERKKRYPDDAKRQGQQDTIYVSIRLDSNGRLLASDIRRSLRYAALDAEVAALVRRASPYPAPPGNVLLGRSDVTLLVPIEFFLNKTRGRR